MLSPDFAFVDETTATSLTGRERELKLVKRVFDSYRDIEHYYNPYVLADEEAAYGPYFLADEEADQGCLVSCGLVQMRLLRERESGFIVNDETCLTACPQVAGDLWYLTEWRIVQSVPPAQDEDGFEVVTWGEVKRMAEEQGMDTTEAPTESSK